MHRILFVCGETIAKTGCNDISEVEVDNFVSKYEAQKEVLEDGNFAEFINTVKELASLENFDYYYTIIRKFSLLRELKEQGIDISSYYDEDKEETEAQRRLDKWTIQEILSDIELKASQFRNKYDVHYVRDEMVAGENTESLLDEFSVKPSFGAFRSSPYLTQLFMGLNKGHLQMHSAPAGVAKALPNSTLIPTPNGWRKVGEIQVGDNLFDADGKPTKVTGVYPQGVKQVWKMTFKDGREALCSKDHLWTYYYKGKTQGKRSWNLRTESLEQIYNRNMFSESSGYNFAVPLTKPVEYEEKKFFIPPYIMGLFLGDGSFRQSASNKSFCYSSEDAELPSVIAQAFGWRYKKNSKFNYSWTFYSEAGKLIHVEDVLCEYPELINAYSHEKYIPETYMTGSAQQRKEILMGLLDTDGSIRNNRLSYDTVSQKMAMQVVDICHSLGYLATMREQNRSNRRTVYHIHIQCPVHEKVNIFNFSKKKQKCVERLAYAETHRFELKDKLAIVKIEPLDYSEEMTCFMVDNSEHLFLMNDYIVTHNTRMSIMDLCYLSSKYMWDTDKQEFVENLNYSGAGLFIATEMNLRREINPIFLACISGVDNNKITNCELTKEERDRVLQAGEILTQSNLFLTDMPDFTSQTISRKIKEMVERHGVENVVFDYLQLNAPLAEEFKTRNGGVPSREDLVIRSLATDLKAYAEQYNVRMITSSQLNGNEKEMVFPDESCLSSAKSIKQKLDAGVIYLSSKDRMKEMKIAESMLMTKRKGFGDDRMPMPNIIGYVYKSRFGLYADQKTKIFSYFDRSIMRITDYIVLDANNNPVSVPKPILVSEGEF